MANYNENILDSMTAVAQKAVSELSFDKTIIGKIIDATDAENGNYLIEFENVKFMARALSDNKFRNNDQVYVTVPQGNWNLQKIILGSYSKAEQKGIIYKKPIDNVVIVTDNFITDTDALYIKPNSTPQEESNYKSSTKDYVINKQLYWSLAKSEFGQFDYIVLKFKVFNAYIKDNQGNYGIRIWLTYKDEKQNVLNIPYFDFENEQFIGNSYWLDGFEQQIAIKYPKGKNIESIKLQLFEKKNFSTMVDYPAIRFDDLEVYFGYDQSKFTQNKLTQFVAYDQDLNYIEGIDINFLQNMLILHMSKFKSIEEVIEEFYYAVEYYFIFQKIEEESCFSENDIITYGDLNHDNEITQEDLDLFNDWIKNNYKKVYYAFYYDNKFYIRKMSDLIFPNINIINLWENNFQTQEDKKIFAKEILSYCVGSSQINDNILNYGDIDDDSLITTTDARLYLQWAENTYYPSIFSDKFEITWYLFEPGIIGESKDYQFYRNENNIIILKSPDETRLKLIIKNKINKETYEHILIFNKNKNRYKNIELFLQKKMVETNKNSFSLIAEEFGEAIEKYTLEKVVDPNGIFNENEILKYGDLNFNKVIEYMDAHLMYRWAQSYIDPLNESKTNLEIEETNANSNELIKATKTDSNGNSNTVFSLSSTGAMVAKGLRTQSIEIITDNGTIIDLYESYLELKKKFEELENR